MTARAIKTRNGAEKTAGQGGNKLPGSAVAPGGGSVRPRVESGGPAPAPLGDGLPAARVGREGAAHGTRGGRAPQSTTKLADQFPASEGLGVGSFNSAQSFHARSTPLRVAVVDDDPALHAQVREQLQRAGESWQVTAYHSGAEALQGLASAPPQVVLMEQTLPDGCGIRWASRLKSRHPQLPVVIHTANGSPEKLFQALMIPALGYVVKNGKPVEWVLHLRKALAGGFTMCEQAERLLPKAFARLGQCNPWGLTHREQEAMLWLCRNKSDKEISEAMGLATSTAQVHLKHAFKKLGVTDRRSAVEKYLPKIPGGGGVEVWLSAGG